MVIRIQTMWDAEAQVWVATSSDPPGTIQDLLDEDSVAPKRNTYRLALQLKPRKPSAPLQFERSKDRPFRQRPRDFRIGAQLLDRPWFWHLLAVGDRVLGP